MIAGVARSLLPVMEQAGFATAQEVHVETLAERIQAELCARDATIVPSTLVGAWARRS
jgi:hypothetical protein